MNLKLIFTPVLIGTLLSLHQGVQAEMEDGRKSLIMAQATPKTAQEQSLKAPVENADFIFQGVVTKIEYRVSDNQPQIPHSFVTFKVEKLLKGKFNQQFITLRFVGGPDGEGNFLTVSGVPLFDIGDRDVLLVKDNGKSGCPLVDCSEGRFRIINEQVFTADGRTILQKSQAELAYGAPLNLKEVNTNTIGNTVIRNVSSNEGNSQDSSGGDVVESRQALASLPSLKPSQLELLIRNQVQQTSTSLNVQAQQFNISVDSRSRFSIAQPQPLSPPQIATPLTSPASRPQSEAERREIEMLQQNSGNPVFPNSKP